MDFFSHAATRTLLKENNKNYDNQLITKHGLIIFFIITPLEKILN